MSRKKREKGYWLKKLEKFKTGATAKARAGLLRTHEHVAHVLVDKQEAKNDMHGAVYTVNYSVAKWYLEELERNDIKL
ncbi:MAG: hypothetical protein GY810_08740 [Aureispira sp.]|nr:hypothetical protein [Aureispira sp.]